MRRIRGVLALVAALVVVLAACSTASDGPAASSPGFPVTVPGHFGPTTVPTRPTRIVAMSWTDADLALGLGVVPVGVAKVTPQVDYEPWAQQRFGGARPATFDTTGEDPIEAVAALQPDLILATKDYHLDQSYAQLSRIAPVVAYRGDQPNSETWQSAQQAAAAALGMPAQGDALVRDTEARIAGATAAHPGLRDKGFSFIVSPRPSGFYVVNSTDDASARFLSQLGMRIAPAPAAQPTSEIPGRAMVGFERVDIVDTDLVIATGPPSSLALLDRQPVFRGLPSVTGGRYVPLDQTAAQAIAFPSPTSLQWALDAVVPRLAAPLGT